MGLQASARGEAAMTEHMSTEEGQKALAKRAGKQPESIILAQIRQYLQLHGYLVIRMQQGLGSHKGLSDLVCIRGGRVVFVEVKTPTGRLSVHQEGFRGAVEMHGGEYLVARSIEDVEVLK